DGSLRTVTDQTNRVHTFSFNEKGQPVSESAPSALSTFFFYDRLGYLRATVRQPSTEPPSPYDDIRLVPPSFPGLTQDAQPTPQVPELRSKIEYGDGQVPIKLQSPR